MTDAEIKELAIKNHVEFILADRSTGLTYSQMMEEDFFSFAHQLEAITREKVLAELVKDNPPAAWEIEGEIIAAEEDDYPFDVCVKNGCVPLYKIPPVPEGWQPIETAPTNILWALALWWLRRAITR